MLNQNEKLQLARLYVEAMITELRLHDVPFRPVTRAHTNGFTYGFTYGLCRTVQMLMGQDADCALWNFVHSVLCVDDSGSSKGLSEKHVTLSLLRELEII